jgi:hypothetical protein
MIKIIIEAYDDPFEIWKRQMDKDLDVQYDRLRPKSVSDDGKTFYMEAVSD